jgi:Fic family protein
MTWNWQRSGWPNFRWKKARLAKAEELFLKRGGELSGLTSHLLKNDQTNIRLEAMATEAMSTSEIEGEYLDRASIRASLQMRLGLTPEQNKSRPREEGIAELMIDISQSFADDLTEEKLCAWQRSIMAGRTDVEDIGRYRTSADPMQIVSSISYQPKVYFEAPPASDLNKEMEGFIDWFNESSPTGSHPLPTLTRAGISHIYFESIHPFEDGNGRVGRAIALKSLSQSLGQPAMIALAATINARKSAYYDALEADNKSLEISPWLSWFAAITLEALRNTQANVEFVIGKAKLLDQIRGQLNERQEKVLTRMFAEGTAGFKGGLSAANYAVIAGSPTATTTRDLSDLVVMGALLRTGERKGTRYHLPIPTSPPRKITIEEDGSIREA